MITLLATADLHLGRRTILPPAGEDDAALSAGTTWNALVDTALRRNVDAFLLLGDIIDEENRYLETFGPLEAGLNRLAEQGIEVLMVAGNHDWNTLTDFAARLPERTREKIRILGEGGRWEEFRLDSRAGNEGERLDFVGWSFPSRHHEADPFSDCDIEWGRDTPVIGLLHADVGGGSRSGVEASPYAPVSPDDFAGTADLWLLGHIHKPAAVRESDPKVLYTGSPHSFSPRETGPHGPLLVEVRSKNDIRISQPAISPVRFETLEVELNEEEPVPLSDLQGRMSEQLRRFDAEKSAELEPVRHVGLRMVLQGRARFDQAPETIARGDDDANAARSMEIAGRMYHILEVENRCRPPIEDLEQIAAGKGPDAELAALILALRGRRAGSIAGGGKAAEPEEGAGAGDGAEGDHGREAAGQSGAGAGAGADFARHMLQEIAELRENILNSAAYMEIGREYPLMAEATGPEEAGREPAGAEKDGLEASGPKAILEEQAYRLLDILLSQRA
jgi:DNA repair exonuclease SbcCD nuclease subunit